MTHPLVTQLRFARSELERSLASLSDEDARRRLGPMNSISWMIGHLASQEHFYWVMTAQGQNLAPDLYRQVGYGQPPSTPPLAEMWAVWQTVTNAADEYLDTLTAKQLQTHLVWKDKPVPESTGTMLQRVIYHYWYHIGEAMAVRQLIGHSDLPEFVGDLGIQGPYRPE
jgi:uncharacterized damage-inducible protein DinB